MPGRVHDAGSGRRDSLLSLPDRDDGKLVKFTGGVFKVGDDSRRYLVVGVDGSPSCVAVGFASEQVALDSSDKCLL